MSDDEEVTCRAAGCAHAARMAIRTTRPTRGEVRSTLWFDDRTAPKTATPYCKEHGAEVAAGLVTTLVDG